MRWAEFPHHRGEASGTSLSLISKINASLWLVIHYLLFPKSFQVTYTRLSLCVCRKVDATKLTHC
jgi:hypothetical protein